MKPEHMRLARACGDLTEAGYECRRVDDFDGAAVADFRGDKPEDVGIFMTHDALDHVRRTAKVELLRELAAELTYETAGALYELATQDGIYGGNEMRDELLVRASAMEASGRTEGE